MKICGTRKFSCLMQAENDLFISGVGIKCDCLPSCSTLNYDIVLNSAKYGFNESFPLSRFPQPFDFEK